MKIIRPINFKTTDENITDGVMGMPLLTDVKLEDSIMDVAYGIQVHVSGSRE